MSPIPWQTPEEAEFVKESILLPIILDVLERPYSGSSGGIEAAGDIWRTNRFATKGSYDGVNPGSARLAPTWNEDL
ncbi:hypothetical protein RE628_09690 [Paenibacillus sp. D2_2]|uniref:hypothetical protein n=1 Tax=Paenibacillus sp. D2_2 TaxID=3073092 RepID=UPI002814F657|nr:hypothetical protein [Paenibacillus sp. D2_2]WMT42569.1 hypothetical protein RE628_09690 [Paenibacillus sp. D2_2]